MITDIDQRLLEKIADLTGKPVGALNIRKDGGCEARQSTEHIKLTPAPTESRALTSAFSTAPKAKNAIFPWSSARAITPRWSTTTSMW
ncbi:MAG: hypothetical protein IJQ98_10540, partial [Oscillospiraceae bacterium]|nr:hypothetical protein [Oscillospiraceae bacterium]